METHCADSARRPLVRVRGYYYPTDHTPEEVFQAIGRLRREAAEEIDRLIQFLDDTGGHCDEDAAVDDAPIDDDEREPSLGFTEAKNQDDAQRHRAVSPEVDAEHDDADHEGDELDRGEEEHDGREPEEDFEPSLVSAEGNAGFSQSGVIDGEQGGPSVADLDRARAKRRPQAKTRRPEAIGDDCTLVMVTRRADGAICHVRPLTATERAAHFAY